MNIQKEELGNSQVQLTVEIAPVQLEKAMKQATRKLGREVRVPGFRPGKAPEPMLRQAIGESRLMEEVMEHLLPETLEQAVKESEVQVYSFQDVEADISSLQPLTFRFVIPTVPVVKLGDVNTISVEREEVSITEEQIEEVLADLRRSRAVWEPSLGPAAYGDRATLDLRLDLMDGTTVADDKGMEMVIEEKAAAEGGEEGPQAPNLGEHLVGMMVNQVKEFPLVYPEAWPEQRLAGRTVLYRATLNELKRRQEAELDDEFAQSVGDFDSLEALRERVHTNLLRQAEDQEFNRVMEAILDGLVDEAEMEYPEAMVRREIERQLQQLERQLSGYGLELDNYLQIVGKSRDEIEDEYRDTAEAFIKRSLALTTYIGDSGLEVSPLELQRELDSLLNSYEPQEAATLRARLAEQPALAADVVSQLLSRKALYQLYTLVTGEEAPPLFPADADADADADEEDNDGEAVASNDEAATDETDAPGDNEPTEAAPDPVEPATTPASSESD